MTSLTRQFVNPGALFEQEDLPAAALLVIDMQVDFLSHKGRLPVERERAEGVIINVNSAIARCQERGIPAVHIGNEFPRFRSQTYSAFLRPSKELQVQNSIHGYALKEHATWRNNTPTRSPIPIFQPC